jgi:hypothetical protein
MGSFNLNADQSSKVLNVQVEGTFSPEDGMASIEAYKKALSTISASEFDIDIDCTKLNVSNADAIPMLEGCFNLYKADGFKKVIFRMVKNPILKMQISRIARKVDLPNYEIVEV